MTRTYVGPFRNPTEGFFVRPVDEHFEIWVRSDRRPDGSCEADHKHTSAPSFDEHEDALDWIDNLHEHFEEDYDQYLDEHSDELAAQERYEAFLNEY
jgi:hypothetical protein